MYSYTKYILSGIISRGVKSHPVVLWKVSLKVVLLGNFGYLGRKTAASPFTCLCVFNTILGRKTNFIPILFKKKNKNTT